MTIQDVSKRTGLSVATISRVINNSGNVSEKTKKAVLQAVEETGYVPNALGRNLRKIKTDNIFVLLPTIDNSFYSKILIGIEREAEKHNYNVMICVTGNSQEQYYKYMDFIKNKLFDGMILISPGVSNLDGLDKIPAVVCGESCDNFNCLQVDIDNEQAAFDAVSHLIDKGKREIVFLGGEYTSGVLREQGYKRALLNAGIKIKEELILKNYYSFEEGQKAVRDYFASGKTADAIFAVSDMLAIASIRVLERLKKKIPEDVAVVGFDNITYAKISNPALSTIMQPRREMGATAFNMLLNLMSGLENKKERVILKHTLIERYSTSGVYEPSSDLDL